MIYLERKKVRNKKNLTKHHKAYVLLEVIILLPLISNLIIDKKTRLFTKSNYLIYPPNSNYNHLICLVTLLFNHLVCI